MARKRVGLVKSVRAAGGAALDSSATGGGDEGLATMGVAVVVGIWWWIVGVPEGKFNEPQDG